MQAKLYMLLILTLLSGLFLISCEKDPIPQDLISEEEMAEILFDFHLAGSFVDQQNEPYQTQQVMKQELIDGVLKERQLSRERFYESYTYYVAHPVMLDSIYERVFYKTGDLQTEYNLRP